MRFRYRRIIFPVAALAAALLLAATLSSVLSPVLVAMLLAVILNPLVNIAGRIRLPRVVTVSFLYVLIILMVFVSAAGLGRQFESLRLALLGEPFHGDLDNNGLINLASVTGREHDFTDTNYNGEWDGGALMELRDFIDRQRTKHAYTAFSDIADEVGESLLDLLDAVAAPVTTMMTSGLQQVAQWVGGMLQLLTLIILIPFYLFFFLVEYPRMTRLLHDLVPPRYQEQVVRIARDIGREQVAFLRGRLLCGFIKALFLWLGMVVLGIDYAMPIALIAGLLSLVPILGFLVGVIPASVIAVTMPGGGTDTLLLVVALFGSGEAIEGALLFPVVLGKETGLHPVMMVVVLLAGGALLGTVGVLLAVPIALIIKVLWREVGLAFYREWAYPEPEDTDEEEEARHGAEPA